MLSGTQGVGKTTTVKQLQADADKFYHYLGRVKTLKFADSIYNIHNIVLDEMEKMTGVPRVKKDGTFLQYLGTEFGRNGWGSNVWVDILKKQIEKMAEKSLTPLLILIDDCRFENEFDAFPNALRVRLHAPEEVRKARAESWRENTNHPSETGLDVYEKDNRFDLYFNTHSNANTPEFISREILDTLKVGTWHKNRKAP